MMREFDLNIERVLENWTIAHASPPGPAAWSATVPSPANPEWLTTRTGDDGAGQAYRLLRIVKSTRKARMAATMSRL